MAVAKSSPGAGHQRTGPRPERCRLRQFARFAGFLPIMSPEAEPNAWACIAAPGVAGAAGRAGFSWASQGMQQMGR